MSDSNSSPDPSEPSDDLNEVLEQMRAMADDGHPVKAAAALLSVSQASATAQLERLFKLRLMDRPSGGITVRTHALLAGPTGSGKTTAVQYFARQNRVPLLNLSVG